MTLLATFVALLLLYSVVSRLLERTVVTAPIVFTVAGLLTGSLSPAALGTVIDLDIFLRLAEIGLVLLLFTDASRTDLKLLRSIRNLPARLLSVGMLLTILLGALAAHLVFPNVSIWEAGILAAILAPTDAGLGQAIVNSPRVPPRIRQALNVEAGLNDGLCVPFLLFFIAMATADAEAHDPSLIKFIVNQLGIGALVGVGIGLIGGWLLAFAHARAWIAASFRQVGLVTLPVLCILASEMFGASMFIAAFSAGLAVQASFKEVSAHSIEFAQQWGEVLNLSVFFLFGLLVTRHWSQFDATSFFYACLSLTVVRILPVSVALGGAHLSKATILFMGWFGPRGLASIVLGLVYLQQEMHTAGEATIRIAVMTTVLVSIFAHGLSAMPGIALYSRTIGPAGAAASDHEEART
jgi:NhaP-type Na+/H+ or K+/H+ antiporter